MNKGCKLSKVDIRDYKIKASSSIKLPEEFELEFRHNIKDQGLVNSCVAHSTSEILEYYSGIDMSTEFIYGIRRQVTGDTGFGMYLVDACKIAQTLGDVTTKQLPGNNEAPKCFSNAEHLVTDESIMQEAYTYRIDSYYRCNTINDIKTAIMTVGPVLAAIDWHDGIVCDASTNFNIEFDMNTPSGYHAVVLYGWNKDGFMLQNSWGTTFGNNGVCILPYKYSIPEARCLIDHDNTLDADIIIKPRSANNCCVSAIYKLISKLINIFKSK